MKRKSLRPAAAAALTLALLSLPAAAGTMSAGPTPPTIDGDDIANYGAVTGDDKWWTDNNTGAGSAKGQTFTTGAAAVEFRSIAYQVASHQKAEPTKTYVVRLGSISGTTFTEIHSETFTQTFTWNGGEFMTWTFDNPPVLLGNTTYAVDIGLASSTSGWPTGIPYINMTANAYPGGQRYTSGQGGVGDSEMHLDANRDRIFHLDLAVPSGSGFELVAGNPPDDAVDALIPPELVATFSQDLVEGSGNITIRNLTASTDEVLAVGDSRVTVSGNLLEIATAGLIDWSTSYAIRIDPGALRNTSGDDYAGISDDTTWNFTTAAGDPLMDAIAELKDHINGAVTLSAAQIEAHKLTIDAERNRFDQSTATIAAVFDLVATYDSVIGPLWIARGQFDRNNQANDLDWTIYHVMQYIMDEVYKPGTIASDEPTLNGFKFGSSAHFPGPVDPPADPRATHTAVIDGSFPDTFGRDTQHWTWPARKPTGTYLAPGTIATVTVPPALVGQGYQVRVGAHSWDLSHRRWVRRLDRSTLLYDLDAPTIKVASPLGGGIYIEVPFGADAGVVSVDITGAVRAPYFSAKSFHSTTLTEWLDTERHHPAPWADFQSEKFMMQVPTSWINNMPDPVSVMADWDAAMDAMNDLMGFPRLRGKETMYPQVDVLLRSSVHAPGYPSVNTTYNPNGNYNGNHGSHLVQGPRTGWHIEFHEQGHAYFFPKFGGERESNVNLHHVAVWHRKFGYDLSQAFAASLGFGGNPNRSLDNAAVTWMTSFNFSPRNTEMHKLEKQYQLKGHAKFVDIVRLFGWEGLDAYWYSFNDDLENARSSPGDDDGKLLRLCESVGEDIRPLFHFWGVHPSDPVALQAGIDAAGLTPSAEIYDLLLYYKSLVPADNAAFRSFALGWWGREPSINGYWTETEHARQWDTQIRREKDGDIRTDITEGEMFNEACAAQVQDRVQQIVDLYFPDGRPGTDYENWAALFPGADLTDAAADLDEDGLSNDEERLWGLDPTSPASRNPIIVPLDGTGNFSYSRRDVSLTGRGYTVWISTDLETWNEDAGAVQTPGPPDANGIQQVAVALSPALLAEPQCFIQVRAE